MKNYDAIRSICDENNKISRKVIDEFLIYYAANRDNLERKMQKRFDSYKHITSELENALVNMLKAQYLAHSIFKKVGSLNRLIKHAELQRLTNEEMNFLKKHAEYPWRFSFSMIGGNPSKDFYIMEDIFSYEKYLLFSPGVSVTLSERPGLLWFNLIGYNGACWQSYGPIGAYNSFDPDDIFFFATELRPDNDDEESILADIENSEEARFNRWIHGLESETGTFADYQGHDFRLIPNIRNQVTISLHKMVDAAFSGPNPDRNLIEGMSARFWEHPHRYFG